MFKKKHCLVAVLCAMVAMFSTITFANDSPSSGFNDLFNVDSSLLVSAGSQSFIAPGDASADTKKATDKITKSILIDVVDIGGGSSSKTTDNQTLDKLPIASGVPGGTLDQITVDMKIFLRAGTNVSVVSDYHGHNWRMPSI